MININILPNIILFKNSFGIQQFVLNNTACARLPLSLARVRTLSSFSNSMTFHDFFHDLLKLSETLGFHWHFQKCLDFPFFRVFLDLKQFNRHKLWCPPKCVPFALFNHFSLSYIVLTYLSNRTFKDRILNSMIFHDLYEP